MATQEQIRGEVGVLMTCDPPMKQYILYLYNTEMPHAVIADLDSTHLLVRSDYVDKIRAKIEQYVEDQNVDADARKKNRKN